MQPLLHTRRKFLQTSAAVAASSAFAGRLLAADADARELTLDGIKVISRVPRAVVEMSAGNCWYPDLLRFSTGELMLNHSLNADTNQNQHNSQAVYLSGDS